MSTAELATLSINTIRTLAIDAIQKANSGHPGLPLGCAPMTYALFARHMRHDPTAPTWPNRDRFVLSAGHGSALLYALLHLTGYQVSLDDLKAFRQWGSLTPGHPEWHLTPGVEATTGPLGQGAANAVGMALAEKYLASLFNRPGHAIVDHYTYALVSDGDVMEGVAYEAASIAGHLQLGKLIYLYDANEITLDGPLDLIMSEDVGKRYAACGWHVQHVTDGDRNIDAIDQAITNAKQDPRPSLIVIKTTIGFGSPKKAGTSSAHGSPLGDAEVAATKTALGCDPALQFFVPSEVAKHMSAAASGQAHRARWQATFDAYRAAHPELASEFERCVAGDLPAGWDGSLPSYTDGAVATRTASGKVLTALCAAVPELFGGDADLGGSTKTIVPGGNYAAAGVGRNLRFGIREHAMGAIANGMLYHGGVRPFVATFFVFSDYMRPPVRLAALNKQPAIYVWTHDSIGVGEDGPTHQPVEHLMALRAMPGLAVFRPADGNETVAGWRYAMTRKDGPVGLVLSRQDLPTLTQPGAPGAERGGYVLRDAANGQPDVLLLATGSEVAIAVAASALLAAQNIAARVVSLPCWELFMAQPAAYRDQVLPLAVTARVSIEAGVTLGWRQWIGDRGIAIGVDQFGASAPGDVIYEKYGLTATAVAQAAQRLLNR